jgi:hypothetical protein
LSIPAWGADCDPEHNVEGFLRNPCGRERAGKGRSMRDGRELIDEWRWPRRTQKDTKKDRKIEDGSIVGAAARVIEGC